MNTSRPTLPVKTKLSIAFVLLFLLIGFLSLDQVDAESRLVPDMATVAQAESVHLSIADLTLEVDQDGEVDLLIEADQLAVGAVTLRLSYDRAIIEVTACNQETFIGACNISNPGQILVTGVSAAGESGDSILATFSVSAKNLGQFDFTITEVITLASVDGADLDSTLASGLVSVTEPPTVIPPTETPTPITPTTTPPAETPTPTPVPSTETPTSPAPTGTPGPPSGTTEHKIFMPFVVH